MWFNRIEKWDAFNKRPEKKSLASSEKKEVVKKVDEEIDAVEAEVLSTIFSVEWADVPKWKWKMKQVGQELHLYVDNKLHKWTKISLSEAEFKDDPIQPNSSWIVRWIAFPFVEKPYSSYKYDITLSRSKWYLSWVSFEKVAEFVGSDPFEVTDSEWKIVELPVLDVITPWSEYSVEYESNDTYSLVHIEKLLKNWSIVSMALEKIEESIQLMSAWEIIEVPVDLRETWDWSVFTDTVYFERTDAWVIIRVEEIPIKETAAKPLWWPSWSTSSLDSSEKIPPKYLWKVEVSNADEWPNTFKYANAYYDEEKWVITIRNSINHKDVIYRLPASSLDDSFNKVIPFDNSLARFTIKSWKLNVERIEDWIVSLNKKVEMGAWIDEKRSVFSTIWKLKKNRTIVLKSEDTFTSIDGSNINWAKMAFTLSKEEYASLIGWNTAVTAFKKVRWVDAREYELVVSTNKVWRVTTSLRATWNYWVLDADGNELLNWGVEWTWWMELLDEDERFDWNWRMIVWYQKELDIWSWVNPNEYEKALLEQLYLTKNVSWMNFDVPDWMWDDEKQFAIRTNDAMRDNIQALLSFENSKNWKQLDAQGNHRQVVSNDEWEIEMILDKRVDSQWNDLGRWFKMKVVRMPEITEDDMKHDWFEWLRNSLSEWKNHEFDFQIIPDDFELPKIRWIDLGLSIIPWAIRKRLKETTWREWSDEDVEDIDVATFEWFNPDMPLRNFSKALSPYATQPHIGDLDSNEQFAFTSWADFWPRVHPDIVPSEKSFLQLHTWLDFPIPDWEAIDSPKRDVTLVKTWIIDTFSHPARVEEVGEKGHMTVIHNRDRVEYDGETYYPATRYMHINTQRSKDQWILDKKWMINKNTKISSVPGDHLHMEFMLYKRKDDATDLNNPASYYPVDREYSIPTKAEIPKKYHGLKWYKNVWDFKNTESDKSLQWDTHRMQQVDPALFYTAEELWVKPWSSKTTFLPKKMKENQENTSIPRNLEFMKNTVNDVIADFEATDGLDDDVISFMKSELFKTIWLPWMFKLESSFWTAKDVWWLARERARKNLNPRVEWSWADDHVGWLQVSRTQMADDLKNNREFYPIEYIKAKLDENFDDDKNLWAFDSDLYYNNKTNIQIAMCYIYAKAMRVKKENHPDFISSHQKLNTFKDTLQKSNDEVNKLTKSIFKTFKLSEDTVSPVKVKKTIKLILDPSNDKYRDLFRVLSFYNWDSKEKNWFPFKFQYWIYAMYTTLEPLLTTTEKTDDDTDDAEVVIDIDEKMKEYDVDTWDFNGQFVKITKDWRNNYHINWFSNKIYTKKSIKSKVPDWEFKVVDWILNLAYDWYTSDTKIWSITLKDMRAWDILNLPITTWDYKWQNFPLRINEIETKKGPKWFFTYEEDKWPDES